MEKLAQNTRIPLPMNDEIPDPLTIGVQQQHDIESGYRVIANDTSSGRPWMWYAKSLEAAQRLGVSLADTTGQDVTICKYVGRVSRPKLAALFHPAIEEEPTVQ